MKQPTSNKSVLSKRIHELPFEPRVTDQSTAQLKSPIRYANLSSKIGTSHTSLIQFGPNYCQKVFCTSIENVCFHPID